MRGPGIKLDLDVRRVWTCPACQRQRRLAGDVATPLCPCREEGVIMQLTADSRLLRRAERITPLPYIKQPRPEGWAIPEPPEEPAEESTPVSSAEPPPELIPQPVLESTPVTDPNPVPEPKVPEEVMDDFGTNLDLPPDPPRESESA